MKIFCGKCNSRAYEIRTGEYSCHTCGSVSPSQHGFKTEVGGWIEPPRQVQPPAVVSQIAPDKREDIIMASKRGDCKNCERPDLILLDGKFCTICRNAAKGKTGEERERALLEAKKRIQSGQIRCKKNDTPPALKLDEKDLAGQVAESTAASLHSAAKHFEKSKGGGIVPDSGPSIPTVIHSAQFHIKLFCADREIFSLPFRIEVA